MSEDSDQPERISRSRRRLLIGREPEPLPASSEVAINPPWAVGLASNCTQCGDCISACPEQILVKNEDSGLPEIDFSRGECTFCQLCAESCEVDVFDTSQKAWDLSVSIGDSCFLTKRIYCRGCGDACPERAIRFSLQLHNKTDIVIDAELCNGCGACVSPCPADAVKIQNIASSQEPVNVDVSDMDLPNE